MGAGIFWCWVSAQIERTSSFRYIEKILSHLDAKASLHPRIPDCRLAGATAAGVI
jgi:hypothetical protein